MSTDSRIALKSDENDLNEDFSDGFGREADVKQIVFAQFGVQGPKSDSGLEFVRTMRKLLSLKNGPRKVERCHHWDVAGYHEDILMAYWADTDAYQKWLHHPAVSSWWNGLPLSGDVGYWREVLAPDADHFGFFGAGLNEKKRVGCIHAIRSKPSEKWGYWGGYRDRLAASKADLFDPEPEFEIKAGQTQATTGKRIRIQIPKNICFVREGAETTHITNPQERESWNSQIEPVLSKWIAYLRDNPTLSGAICLRDTIEQDLESGTDQEKHNTLIYFVSLRHMERAARTQPSHLALYSTFMGMMEELAAASITPEVVIWSEAHILSRDTAEIEYVNCHERTGLIPFCMK
jgi:hypothetical protein